MTLFATKEVFKIDSIDTSYYTFKKDEHELVLLKKLDDNKIFYNNTIYDKDFFYYYKLEGFIEQIYELRDNYIRENFNLLVVNEEPSLILRERIKKIFQKSIRGIKRFLKKFFYSLMIWKRKTKLIAPKLPFRYNIIYDPNNCDEITGLTKVQYDILVKAYKYEFDYKLTFDLLNPKIQVKKNFVNPMIKDFFNDWFYILGWKSIKPVYPTFMCPYHWHHYDDDANEKFSLVIPYKKERTYPKREDLIFRNRYDNPLDAGTRFDFKWIEDKYDEQQKFNEYDINCKTNTYYARYVAYNEIYNKDYPEEKKFKTDLIHDFTEEEIKENYENMIDKEKLALNKFNFVMFDEKRKTAVFKFFEELEKIEVSREKLRYDFHWNHDEDSDMWLTKELEILLLERLNDPRYILVKPLIDAYFEVFRTKGYYFEDESFAGPPAWTETGAHKKLMKHLMYYDLSYERQYMFAEKTWLIDDYMEIEDLENDEHHEDEYYALGLGLGLFIWLVIMNIYGVIFWLFKLDLPFQSSFSALVKYAEILRVCVYDEGEEKLRQLACPEIYYGLELRRPRSRIKTTRIILPLKFHDHGYYSYSKRRARSMLPYGLLEQLCKDLDEKDYGLNRLDRRMREFGTRHYLLKIRFSLGGVEPRWPWDYDKDPSLLMRFSKRLDKIGTWLRYNIIDEYITPFIRRMIDDPNNAKLIRNLKEKLEAPVFRPLRLLGQHISFLEKTTGKVINRCIENVKAFPLNAFNEVKRHIINFFNKFF